MGISVCICVCSSQCSAGSVAWRRFPVSPTSLHCGDKFVFIPRARVLYRRNGARDTSTTATFVGCTRHRVFLPCCFLYIAYTRFFLLCVLLTERRNGRETVNRGLGRGHARCKGTRRGNYRVCTHGRCVLQTRRKPLRKTANRFSELSPSRFAALVLDPGKSGHEISENPYTVVTIPLFWRYAYL